MNYMERFFKEKDLPIVNFEWVASNGQHQIMSNEYVIEILTDHTSGKELEEIKFQLIMLDFKNADINKFLFHLAKQYVETQIEN